MKRKFFYKTLSFLVVLTIILSVSSYHPSAITGTPFTEKIDISLRQKKNDDDIDVIIKLKKEADLRHASPDEVKPLLLETSKSSQEALLSFLEKEQKKGNVKEYSSFFIINSIHVRGKASILDKIARRGDVENIRANRKIRADKEETIKKSSSQIQSVDYIPWNLKEIQADKTEKTGKGIVVGIIDTGVNPLHPEIAGSMEPDGFRDFVTPKNTFPKDSTGHGTHVAGTILGKTYGVAKDATFIAARVFTESGEGSDAILLAAGDWILSKRPHVVNNSWSGKRDDNFYNDIIEKWRRAGIFPVFASGNTGPSTPGGEGSIENPASLEGAFAVGALDRAGKLASFSLRGPSKNTTKTKPDLSAPGVNIKSANFTGGYTLKSGTSMATPHVAGTVALMLEANKSLTIRDIETILRQTATPLTDDNYPSSPNMGYGYGKLNAFRAVKAASKNNLMDFATFTGRTLIQGSDFDHPVLKTVTPSTFYNSYAFDINAFAADSIGIKSVKLFLKNEGEDQYIVKDFTLYKGNKKSGHYAVTITPKDLRGNHASYYIKAEDALGKVEKTAEVNASILTGIRPGYENDFENGADGFVFGGKTPMWEVGVPENIGPSSAYRGKNVVGTNLKGSYEGLVDSLLISPPIDLTAVNETPVLSFWDWSELSQDNGFQDSAEVWIGEIDDHNPQIDNIKYEDTPVLVNKTGTGAWTEHTISLSDYKGKKIVVMFSLKQNGFGSRKEAGYYIDAFRIENASDEKPLPPSKNLHIENFEGSGEIRIGFTPVANKMVNKYHLYRSLFKDRAFEKVGEGVSSPFVDFPAPQTGTYYYRIKSVVNNRESDFSKAVSHSFTKGDKVSFFDFENGDEGWTSTEPGKWERGIPNQQVFPDGPQPSNPLNKTGNTVFMTGLNSPRKPHIKYELISPYINLFFVKKPILYYMNWYQMNGKNSTGSNEDLAEIWFRERIDGEWERVFSLDATAFRERTINGYERKPNVWSIDGFPIPKKFISSQFQMKFVLNSKDNPSHKAGWYIDNVGIYDISNSKASSFLESATYENIVTNPSVLGEKQRFFLANSDSATTVFPNKKTTLPATATVKILDTDTYVKSEIGSGNFIIKHPAGRFKAIAYNDTHRSSPFEIILERGGITEKEIILNPVISHPLSFKIKGRNGEPVMSEVRIFEGEESLPKYQLSSVSEAYFPSVREGKYKVLILAPGYQPEELDIKLDAPLSLPSVTLSKPIKSGERKERRLDRGNFASAGQAFSAKKGTSYATIFHFEKESVLKSISLAFKKSFGKNSIGKSFSYSIYTANNKDGYPGRMILGPVITSVKAEDSFMKIDLPDLFVKGDVYIAYTQLEEGGSAPRLAVDRSTPVSGKTFRLIEGIWTKIDERGVYMIRVEAEDTELLNSDSNPGPTPAPNPGPTPAPNPGPTPAPNPGPTFHSNDNKPPLISENEIQNESKIIQQNVKRKKKRPIGSKISIRKYLKKNRRKIKISLKNFYRTRNLKTIKVHIQGLKRKKDFDIIYKKRNNTLFIHILGKGRLNHRIIKSFPLKIEKK